MVFLNQILKLTLRALRRSIIALRRAIIAFLGSLIVSYIVIGYLKRKKERQMVNGTPPGSLGLYLIGHMLQYYRNADKFDQEMTASYGTKNYLTHLFFNPCVRIGVSEDRATVNSKALGHLEGWPQHFNSLLFPKLLEPITGKQHDSLRCFFYLCFTPEIRPSYVDLMDRTISKCLVDMSANAMKVHSSETLKSLSLGIFLQFIFQETIITKQELAEFATLFETWVEGFKAIVPFASLPFTAMGRASKVRREIASKLKQMIQQYKDESVLQVDDMLLGVNNPVLDAVLRFKTEADVEFTLDQICDNLMILLFAAYETTGSVLGTLVTLLFNPCHYEDLGFLRDELVKLELGDDGFRNNARFLGAVVDECLRAFPPVLGFHGTAKEDIQLSSSSQQQFTKIPKGMNVSISVPLGHMDSKTWGFDMGFNPTRMLSKKESNPVAFRTQFFPFGLGGRICTGESLARLEMRVFIYHLARNYHVDLIESEQAYFPINCLKCKFQLRPLVPPGNPPEFSDSVEPVPLAP